MAGEKPLSSLFGDMQGGSSVPTPSSTTSTPLPNKKENIFGALEGVSEPQKQEVTEPVPSPSSESTGIFGEAVPQKIETVLETSETLPEVEILNPTVAPISDISPEIVSSPLPVETSIPEENISELPEVEIPPVVATVLPAVSEDVTLPELENLPETQTLSDVSVPESKTESTFSLVSEIVSVPVVPPESPELRNTHDEESKDKKDDLKLTQYLRADAVYQEMLRVDNQEKIRLQIAVRYTLLMFAIFLVFAWIVSNRVIMFGFSEFVWLARIRDALFAVMAGLFSLTLWFGSISWMRQVYLIAFIRTLAIVFFIAVLVALYLPL